MDGSPPSPGPRAGALAPRGASALAVARAVAAVLAGELGPRAAVATVIDRAGSAPQIVGAKLLLTLDRALFGTVGGGALEAKVIEACEHTLREGTPRRLTLHLVRDLGMCCGGRMEIFVEHIEPQARVIIIGGGHVSQALAPMARLAGWEVTVLDDRDELLACPAFDGCSRVSADVDELASALPDLRATDHLVIVTRDHGRDERALDHLLDAPHAYIGMIGSRRKVHAVMQRLQERRAALGRPAPATDRLHAPIGLDLGGRSPGEIAVSILAQLVAARHGGQGAPLSRLEGTKAGPLATGRPPP